MIAVYISSHGFGHLTRTIVHIERYLEETKKEIYIVCGNKQIDFAKQLLKKFGNRVIYKKMITDIGLINKVSSLEVDKKELEKQLIIFMNSWKKVIIEEAGFLKRRNIEKVITDISPLGMLVGRELNVPVEAISNFTWYNQYKYLNLSHEIVEKYYEVEQFINKFYVYPLGLDLSHINCEKEKIDYVSRPLNSDKIEQLKNKYKKIIFISCGKSADLEVIEIKNFNGTIFYTEGISLSGSGNHIKLPIDIEDTQNYIGASSLIISKAGWGTVAEATVGEIPMVLIERDGVLEDTHIINELKKQNKAISINMEELKVLDIEKIKEKIKSLATN